MVEEEELKLRDVEGSGDVRNLGTNTVDTETPCQGESWVGGQLHVFPVSGRGRVRGGQTDRRTDVQRNRSTDR